MYNYSSLILTLTDKKDSSFGCKERSSHSSHCNVTPPPPRDDPIAPKPVMCHFCCDGTWCRPCHCHPPSRTIECSCAPLECWSVQTHLWAYSQPLYSVCLQPWWGLMSEICAIYWGKNLFPCDRQNYSWIVFNLVSHWNLFFIPAGCESWNCRAKSFNFR